MSYLPNIYGISGLQLPPFEKYLSVSVDKINLRDETPHRVFWQTEPPEIVNVKHGLLKHYSFYDLILTWDRELLKNCPNARFFPAGGVWAQDGIVPCTKKFGVSMLISSMHFYTGQQFRLRVFDWLDSVNIGVPIMKHKSPPWIVNKCDLLLPYQYHICIENVQHENFFTEKINDACATRSIPIYWGAPNIEKFYNPEGMLTFETTEELYYILSRLTPDFYESKRAAIEENYHKACAYKQRTENLIAVINEFFKGK